MSKLKTEFRTDDIYYYKGGNIKISIPRSKTRKLFIRIYATNQLTFLNKDIERFAVNILKAMGSKKLK